MRFSKEEEHLCQKDKKLKKIIDKNGHISFQPNKKNQFDTLVGIVISQFISTKAADSIFKNMKKNKLNVIKPPKRCPVTIIGRSFKLTVR